MKISKIIFLSLIAAIAVIIIAGAVDIRINGRKGSISIYDNMKKSRVDLQSFKVLRMSGAKSFSIVKGDSSYIEIAYQKDSLPPEINYILRNDTLILQDLNLSRKRMLGKICVASEPNSFLLKNSDLILNKNFIQDSSSKLLFDLDNSTLHFYQNNKSKSVVSVLDIKQINKSRIYGNGFRLDSLNVDLQNSRTELHIRVGKVNGTVTEKGYLHLDSANEIALKKDSESEIRIF